MLGHRVYKSHCTAINQAVCNADANLSLSMEAPVLIV